MCACAQVCTCFRMPACTCAAAQAYLVDVGVPHLGQEAESWWRIRVVDGELEPGLKGRIQGAQRSQASLDPRRGQMAPVPEGCMSQVGLGLPSCHPHLAMGLGVTAPPKLPKSKLSLGQQARLRPLPEGLDRKTRKPLLPWGSPATQSGPGSVSGSQTWREAALLRVPLQEP